MVIDVKNESKEKDDVDAIVQPESHLQGNRFDSEAVSLDSL